jgi:glutathione synthase/RimK-type ligase-like ATP-grasp enzyme
MNKPAQQLDVNTDDENPQPLIGLAPLMRQAFSGVDLRPFGSKLVQRAQRFPRDANTLMDLSTVLQLTGNHELGLATQAQALQIQQHYHLPAPSGKTAIRLLAIVSAGDLMANTPVEFLIEGSDIALDYIYVDSKLSLPDILPEHDVVFIAVGESDHNRPLLAHIAERAKTWTRPVLNRAECIANLTRNGACALLGAAPGISMPVSARITRETLARIGNKSQALTAALADGVFPIIVRPVGSHAGHGLEKLDDASAIDGYLQTESSAEFYISRFVDYRNDDGQFRKYRIILIEGKPYICHMAISQNWMIHYLNAGMAESAEKRAEEARFMVQFENFAKRHTIAFKAITDILQLDYVGLDCSETQDGKLLIFEADSDMIVHAMDSIDMYPYKRPVMQKIFDAFHAMLTRAIANKR